jgi:hypothetical protein
MPFKVIPCNQTAIRVMTESMRNLTDKPRALDSRIYAKGSGRLNFWMKSVSCSVRS